MSFHSRFGAIRRRALCSVHNRGVLLGQRGPIVSFTFDDFPRTAWTVGAPILEKFGGRATYYVAMGLIETTNSLGEQFREEDLHSLVERGHELASHTFSHISSRRVRFELFKQDVERGERAIHESTGITASNNFAYPYGDVTLSVKRRLGPQMRSCRGTCGGLNGPKVDLNLLRANSLYGNADNAEGPMQLILENERRKGWLIFYSHDVTAKPSPFGCTPDLLETMVSFAGLHGARLLTVAHVTAELEQQRKHAPVHQELVPQ